MQFLKTLFWVAVAVILVLFASVNWRDVTITLWGGLEADVKLPILVLFSFLLGFLPTLIVYSARLWSLRRRLDTVDRQTATVPVAQTPLATSAEDRGPPAPADLPGQPAPMP